MEPGALGRRRRRGGAFSIARLFANGEAGGVYDPSDLTAEKVAWRRNLLTWSEDFTNAAWTKGAIAVTANSTTAPNGTVTADTLAGDGTNAFHLVTQSTSVISNAFVGSVFLKQNTARYAFVQVRNGSNGATVIADLQLGTISTPTNDGTATGAAAQIIADANGFYRVVLTTTLAATTTAEFRAGLTNSASSVASYATSDSVFSWGAQLEPRSTATAYQRITDFTSDFLAAFPTHGLYQDAAGTTPVTALGQPVGLVIDSKTGGLANVGPEQLSNTDFTSNVTGWTAVNVATLAWDASGAALLDITGGGGGIQVNQTLSLTVGRTYRLQFTARSGTFVGNIGGLIAGVPTGVVTLNPAYTTYNIFFTAPSANPTIGILRVTTVTGTVFFDNISVREVPGVHAIQPTNSSRPLLDGRVNLLTRTEQFDHSDWQRINVGVGILPVVTANAGIAPDGTTTADRVQFDCANTGSASNRSSLLQPFTATIGASYRNALYIKAWDASNVGKSIRVTSDAINGAVYTLTADWQLVGTTGTATGTTSNLIIETRGTFTTQTADVLIWGADLRLAADAAYPYQRVAAATDYADVGVPRAFAFDGFDDSLYTASNMDLSGTDKVTVLAGVRKLSDAALGIVAELSASAGAANPGSFFMAAPRTAATGDFAFNSGGTAFGSGAISANVYPAPTTRVMTGSGNISGDSALLRIDGLQAASSTADQGTGNFGSYVLFIGRRNNASVPLNGKAYQLIVRGALTDAATLAQAERYVGAKTGIFL